MRLLRNVEWAWPTGGSGKVIGVEVVHTSNPEERSCDLSGFPGKSSSLDSRGHDIRIPSFSLDQQTKRNIYLQPFLS